MGEKPEASEVKLMGKWSFDGVKVNNPGLVRYISLRPVLHPHTGGRHEHQRLKKAEAPILERLMNQLMRPGPNGGKKAKVYRVVKNALEIIHLKTGANPLQVLVHAIENSAPMEDTTRISYGGIVYHVAVDVSPLRRVDLALRFLAAGVRKATFGNPRTIDECLANEIILAAARDAKSYAVSKRDEQERISLSSR